MNGRNITVTYDDRIVRYFMIASILFGIVGMAAGVLAATQLNFWQANFGLEWTTFGRVRPLHTNAVIFAFVGNMMFAGIYYSVQRLCKVRLASNALSLIHFWGWQLIILAAAITLPLGLSRGKEYAELIWPINVAVALIWVVFAVNFFWTLAKRNEPTLYVAIWFYISTILTVAMLYIVNHLSLPTSLTHSYPIFAGVQDALVQWWYGHNAVAFFLTTPILGIMYYFMPKAAERPVYSYRLSVIHFWSLVFIYIWAGPHHLLNTALPQWLQALGMLFSLMLWAPSWGGMLNGLLTLRGAWDKLRTDPVIKFFAAGVTFYGMSTFEGPLLSIRAVNSLAHYTDWIIGHVHSGALGWNGLMAAGLFYWLAPRLWNTRLYSKALADLHFWLAMTGILLYVGAMWVSGITQGLMLNATTEGGTLLAYPSFLETNLATRNPMFFRLIGGGLFLIGMLLMTYNIWRTARSGKAADATAEVYTERPAESDRISLVGGFFNAPTLYCLGGIFTVCLWLLGGDILGTVGLFCTIAIALAAIVDFERRRGAWGSWYERLLANPMPFTVLVFVAAAIGGAVQIIPALTIKTEVNTEDRLQVLYTPLELAGRDIYVSEGCYVCHSQMIRTMVPEVLRYGPYSRLGESIYDHPFQWGSRRTGPDLARVGTGPSGDRHAIKYGNDWHYKHLVNPRDISPDSNMPSYPWLESKATDFKSLPGKIAVQSKLGVPYPAWSADQIQGMAMDQASAIAADLREKGILIGGDKQIVAVIAYLQKLGRSIPAAELEKARAAGQPVEALLVPSVPKPTAR